jgi:type II secretory pathway component PulF
MQVADSLDEENELAVKTVSGLIEPVILIIMGLLVGGVAISMFLPLFDLAAAGGGAAP